LRDPGTGLQCQSATARSLLLKAMSLVTFLDSEAGIAVVVTQVFVGQQRTVAQVQTAKNLRETIPADGRFSVSHEMPC
jgi:hypothetical protein